MAKLDQPVRTGRREIPVILVQPDACLKNLTICFGMKLCGINIGLVPDHLERAGVGGKQMRTAGRQFLNRFLVSHKSHESVRQVGQ